MGEMVRGAHRQRRSAAHCDHSASSPSRELLRESVDAAAWTINLPGGRPRSRRANFDDVSAGGLRRTLLAMCLLKSSSKSDRSTNLLERRNTRRDLYLRPLPGGRKTDQNSSARGSHGRLRPLPPSERLLHLSSQTPMHADPEADHQALGA